MYMWTTNDDVMCDMPVGTLLCGGKLNPAPQRRSVATKKHGVSDGVARLLFCFAGVLICLCFTYLFVSLLDYLLHSSVDACSTCLSDVGWVLGRTKKAMFFS